MAEAPQDPLVAAIAVTLEEVLRRGLDITPTDSGWIVRVVDESDTDLQPGVVRRAW